MSQGPSDRLRITVARVEHVVRAQPAHALCVGELVRWTGVSARSLFRAFQHVHGCGPIQWLRRQRLDRVRATLAGAAPGVSVTSAAIEHGFEHLGHFAAFYRRAFGETPSATLRRSRAARRAHPFPGGERRRRSRTGVLVA